MNNVWLWGGIAEELAMMLTVLSLSMPTLQLRIVSVDKWYPTCKAAPEVTLTGSSKKGPQWRWCLRHRIDNSTSGNVGISTANVVQKERHLWERIGNFNENIHYCKLCTSFYDVIVHNLYNEFNISSFAALAVTTFNKMSLFLFLSFYDSTCFRL